MKKIIDKKGTRLRRATRTRAKIRELRVARLTVHRTPQHMYAQIIDGDGGKVLVSASTVQEAVRADLKGTGNVAAAAAVGKAIASGRRSQNKNRARRRSAIRGGRPESGV